MERLYFPEHDGGPSHGHVHLAGDDDLVPLIDLGELGRRALENVFAGFEGVVEPNLYTMTMLALSEGIERGWASARFNTRNDEHLRQLKSSLLWFSKRKTWHQQQALASLLVDGDTRRSWEAFREAAKPILGTYNERWLKVEYNTAVRSARMLANMEGYATTRDLYPNLKYLRTRSANPREEHLYYVGIVRPFDDPFWDDHLPPIDFNCRCDVEPVDDDVTELVDDLPKPARPFRNNVYVTRQVLNDTPGEDQPYPLPKSVARKLRDEDLPENF